MGLFGIPKRDWQVVARMLVLLGTLMVLVGIVMGLTTNILIPVVGLFYGLVAMVTGFLISLAND
jgi:uncharacterized Tic20 family protein